MRITLWIASAVIAAAVIYSLAPDVARYMKIRSM
jgi:hypothetical protein